ncbi:hypothetical protein NN6n1_36520 [Shinella zoogloeoides]
MSGILSEHVIQSAPTYNEAEVRFHIIDPIVRALGYPGEGSYLKLEEKLNYPYFFIGRKNKKKDLPLGFPDYRAGVLGGRGCFIIEAKAAGVGISNEEVEQGHSYAAHAEVKASYFILCNGTELRVYETFSGPASSPILALHVGEINERFYQIENILSPVKLERHCRKIYDLDLSLGCGLPSSVKIRDGIYGMELWDYRIFINEQDMTAQVKPNFTALDQQLSLLQENFELRVGDGRVHRDADGRISASMSFVGATKNNDAAMKLIGVDRLTFSTSEKFISDKADEPTVWESTADFGVPKGTPLPPLFGDAVPTDLQVDLELYVRTRIFISGDEVLGDYLALAKYHVDFPGLGRCRFELDVAGPARLRLLI